MGHAIFDYWRNGEVSHPLEVLSRTLDDDVMPLEVLFRNYDEMPLLEQLALDRSSGRVLDVGAGAGCHSLVLQQRGADVTAIDVSPLSVLTMKKRGLQDVLEGDFFTLKTGGYDTILMLMNGIGIVGRLKRMPVLFRALDRLLVPGGQLLCDSSDIKYLYEAEDGTLNYHDKGYYGEHTFMMRYGDVVGKPFNWLYVDADRLRQVAYDSGYKAEVIATGNHFEYLARIVKL